jgi:hypothetical protein
MLAAAKEHDIVAIMANQYAENPHSMSVERARQLLAEKKTIYKERLGRSTQTSLLRNEHIASSIQDMMKNTYTPYKNKTGTHTPQLRRSSSQLSVRSNEGGMPRKKVARNLVVLGSS